jgi:hypothetical protein
MSLSYHFRAGERNVDDGKYKKDLSDCLVLTHFLRIG